jgi:hypothetical protein
VYSVCNLSGRGVDQGVVAARAVAAVPAAGAGAGARATGETAAKAGSGAGAGTVREAAAAAVATAETTAQTTHVAWLARSDYRALGTKTWPRLQAGSPHRLQRAVQTLVVIVLNSGCAFNFLQLKVFPFRRIYLNYSFLLKTCKLKS